ncbi:MULTISPECIES: hypothetical protein [unclassified Marinobacter]|uniref:hypothetical protein n=1 Tax=unclassified Marinobacter TaxID=83889 RepID=UPI001268CD52|nr:MULTISPECIES: hypothetical protein [unclassified Marinobacter]QFS87611.1 hypothetical protein FIV08_12330 [Marinobacter sp. THAF197a]QFT51396.1 hypothetical protein FIU96_12245 [Marinobacter sp. THAF39]
MTKPELLFKLTLKHVVARTLGVTFIVLSPIAIGAEFIARYSAGELNLGEFVSDVCDFFDESIELIVKGGA